MSEPESNEQEHSDTQEERREEAEKRNPDLHGQALEALEGEEDGAGRPLGG